MLKNCKYYGYNDISIIYVIGFVINHATVGAFTNLVMLHCNELFIAPR